MPKLAASFLLAAASESGHLVITPLGLAYFCGTGSALRESCLLRHAHKIRDRLFVDDRRLSLSRLPDCWHVAARQDCQEALCHDQSSADRTRTQIVPQLGLERLAAHPVAG
jgi:hypothetical protein